MLSNDNARTWIRILIGGDEPAAGAPRAAPATTTSGHDTERLQ